MVFLINKFPFSKTNPPFSETNVISRQISGKNELIWAY